MTTLGSGRDEPQESLMFRAMSAKQRAPADGKLSTDFPHALCRCDLPRPASSRRLKAQLKSWVWALCGVSRAGAKCAR
jgi:hypothetical protein